MFDYIKKKKSIYDDPSQQAVTFWKESQTFSLKQMECCIRIHVTEGISEEIKLKNTTKKKINKLALMGFLHAAASAMVEFYSTCFEI